ncbi:hypothetical protein K469DRAFT_704966 [Zopfia rhizophila CBS 207.26]|uniref:Mitotic checkpoint regulator, MAD2B-interacting-domain-containing protein n=1 Tax=Zopfia rhizophila CBS 207.26 TaxID=1314779 RepID=A0A6A6E5T7_9PEZI|nr:hypothetical protein K469DRAFT_704966 [Zopfia rhizophila CBS 207.26]
MNLIAYSDSEDSDKEAPLAPNPPAKPAQKPSFQKVVDRSNPGKIKVNLPSASKPQVEKDDIEAEAPPAKKARTGGGAFSGFNSMLPAPKKSSTSTGGAISGGKRGVGKSLGSGISLKTGAEPAFSREPVNVPEYNEDGTPVKKEPPKEALNLPPAKETLSLPPPTTGAEKPESGVKTAGKPMKFVPLSVARGKKKKPVVPRPSGTVIEETKPTPAPSPAVEAKPALKPKVSLFSLPQEEESLPSKGASSGQYQSLHHGAEAEDDARLPDDAFDQVDTGLSVSANPYAAGSTAPAGPQALSNLATELNLSEAEKRQLFGRKGRGNGPDLSAVNIVEFNTDTEYAHNEKLRAAGETVQHNALKSISGTGKNSLRSLVNVATTQKDALEEHFAQGRRNKREAGNKYGW